MIAFQGILLSMILFRLIKLLFPEQRWTFHFITVLFLSFFSSASWYASQLMPDIFSLILALTLICLVLEQRLKVWEMLTYGLLLFMSCITHLSHLPLLLLCLGFIGGLRFLKPGVLKPSKSFWLITGAALISAWVFLGAYNATFSRGFGLSKASNVFITANLGEMGILKMYLDENCDDPSTSLCEWKDRLPLETGGYLWDGNGPVQTHPGGWIGANDDYAVIVEDFFTKPRYLKWFLFGAVKATFKQMFQIELGSGLQYQYVEGTPPYWPMKEHFKQELNEYLGSIQNKKDELPISFFKVMQYVGIFVSLLIIGWAVLERLLTDRLHMIILLCTAFYFFHAAITGVLANVYDRLQCRVLPLLMLLALLAAFQIIVDRKQRSTDPA